MADPAEEYALGDGAPSVRFLAWRDALVAADRLGPIADLARRRRRPAPPPPPSGLRPAAPRGGYSGRMGRGDLYSQVLEDAVFALSAGETSQPVVSERGVHILHVSEADEEGRVVSQIFFPLEITEEDVQRAEAALRAGGARAKRYGHVGSGGRGAA